MRTDRPPRRAIGVYPAHGESVVPETFIATDLPPPSVSSEGATLAILPRLAQSGTAFPATWET